MKYQLIINNNTAFMTSDEKPQSNDIVYVNNDVYNHEIRTFTTAFGDANLDDCIKIVAIDKSYDKYNHSLPSINWNGLEEEFGIVDVEKLAEEYFNDYYAWIRNVKEPYTEEQISQIKADYVNGFKKAQSLNEKKFSLEDMEGFIDYMYSHKTAHKYKDGYGDFQVFTDLMRQYIQSLQQPKIFDIEVEMEVNDTMSVLDISDDYPYVPNIRPKITNNSIKIIKKL